MPLRWFLTAWSSVMAPRLIVCAFAIVGLLPVATLAEESNLLALQNNPFTRPEVLKAKPAPPPTQQRAAVVPEKLEFELSATMVSGIMPMVVVNGELLGIGDRIEGFELIAVMEGKAIFTRAGKKISLEVNPKEPE